MRQTADVVVIGSGGFGAATAYFLAQRGHRVALVDKFAISSQTSPRAAGLAATIRSTDLMTTLASRAADLLEDMERETGEPLGVMRVGSVKLARVPEDVAVIEREDEMGRHHELGARQISPQEVHELNPLIEPVGILAALHIPTDLYFEPQQVGIGFATAAATLGARLFPNTPVTAIRRTGDQVSGVDTLAGPIDAPVVIDAAGAWARQVARLAGCHIPLVPMRHQLLITEPLPGVQAELPMLRVIDSAVYMRSCWGGLLVGGYETNPTVIDIDAMPATFQSGDVELDLPLLKSVINTILPQVPILRDAPVRVHRGGVPALTVDGRHLVGEVPGAPGMFMAAGCNVSGLSISPAIGEQLAQWITDGQPSVDLTPLALTRFGPEWADESKARAAATRHYSTFYRSTV